MCLKLEACAFASMHTHKHTHTRHGKGNCWSGWYDKGDEDRDVRKVEMFGWWKSVYKIRKLTQLQNRNASMQYMSSAETELYEDYCLNSKRDHCVQPSLSVQKPGLHILFLNKSHLLITKIFFYFLLKPSICLSWQPETAYSPHSS